MLLNINRCLKGGRGGEYCRLPHSRWCVCLSVCSYGHICFGSERFVCPSVFVFLPPPSSSTPSVSGGRLRNDQSGFDAIGPCPGFLQHMRPGSKVVWPSCLEQEVWWDISAFDVQPLFTPWPVRADSLILPDVWTPYRTYGRQEVLWRGISDGEGEKMTVASFSAIIRQDSPEEVRNQHPTWSMLPVLNEYRSGCFCKLIRSEWKDSTAGYDPSLSTFNGLFMQQPFHINHGSSLQLGYNMLTKWRLLISY